MRFLSMRAAEVQLPAPPPLKIVLTRAWLDHCNWKATEPVAFLHAS